MFFSLIPAGGTWLLLEFSFLLADLGVLLGKIIGLCLIIVCVEMVLEDFGMFWPTIRKN